jgi:chromosome segregation ATPase
MKLVFLSIMLVLAACSSPEEPSDDGDALAEAQQRIAELEVEATELKDLVDQRDNQIASMTGQIAASSRRKESAEKRYNAYLDRRREDADAAVEEAQRKLDNIVKEVGQ